MAHENGHAHTQQTERSGSLVELNLMGTELDTRTTWAGILNGLRVLAAIYAKTCTDKHNMSCQTVRNYTIHPVPNKHPAAV